MKTRAFLLVAISAFVVSTSGAQAQGTAAADRVAANFQHEPNTRVAALAELGLVERRGTGPIPMILIPGAPFRWSVWEEFMQRNADRYTLYAITIPGYGGTAPYPMPTAMRADGTPDFTNRVWSKAVVDGIVRLITTENIDGPLIVSVHLRARTRQATDRSADSDADSLLP